MKEIDEPNVRIGGSGFLGWRKSGREKKGREHQDGNFKMMLLDLEVGPRKDKGGNMCLEAEKVGEILNEYFASVFTQEKDMEGSEICMEHANMPGHFEIMKEVVLDLLNGIKVDKSQGLM
eukprot:g41313.t1